MCNFNEPYFGATYPDACCIDGYLWDLDSCDAHGGPLRSGGEVLCPQCQHEGWLEGFKDNIVNAGYDASYSDKPRQYVHEKVFYEQAEDEAKIRKWWLAGYDSYTAYVTEGTRVWL